MARLRAFRSARVNETSNPSADLCRGEPRPPRAFPGEGDTPRLSTAPVLELTVRGVDVSGEAERLDDEAVKGVERTFLLEGLVARYRYGDE